MTAIEPTPTRIPIPRDFPVEWEQPGDEQMLWTMDRMHFPGVITPLDDSVIRVMYQQGQQRAAERFSMPVRFNGRRFNGYHYMSVAPVHLPREELEAMGKRFEEKIGAAVRSIRHDWEEAYLPEIQKLINEAAGIDYRSADLAQLNIFLDDAIDRFGRSWEIHFSVAFPMLMAPSLFEEFYRDVFGEDDTLNAFRLLQGLPNLTSAMGRDLWELSLDARQSPEVLRAVQEQAPAAVVGALEQSKAGRGFLTALQSWLDRYGHRGNALGISSKTWIEDPSQVMGMLKDYVARTDYDPVGEQAQLARARDEAIAEARARLTGYPEQVVGQFEGLLKVAQDATVISEDHAYWIDFRATYELRRVVVALGHKLAEAGVLENADDVVYFTLDELREAAREPQGRDSKALAAQRKADMARYATMTAPPAVGTMPPSPPPDNPMFRALGKFFGTQPPPIDDPHLVKGVGGSRGTVTGKVKVVHSLDEAQKLQPGDILVVETTTPPWTPLFNTAAAVVTDTGGVLSHCAVVAREYGIPAVVGTGAATLLLKDGQVVEVDGTAGTVRVIGD